MDLDIRHSKAQLAVAYDGPALERGSMDVKDFAPALLSLGELCEESGRIINGERSQVSVHVRAGFEKGSFLVTLDIAQSLSSLFTDNTANAKSILEAIGLLGGGGISLFKLIRWLKGSKPTQVVESKGDNNITIAITGDNNAISVSRSVAQLYNSPEVRKKIASVVQPLSIDGINEFQARDGGEVVERITEQDREYILAAANSTDERIVEEGEFTSTLQVEKVSFADGLTWRFTDGNASFNATMRDQFFLGRVTAGHVSFASGDALRMRIKKRVIQKEQGLSATYTVLEVLEYLPAPRQLNLTEDEGV